MKQKVTKILEKIDGEISLNDLYEKYKDLDVVLIPDVDYEDNVIEVVQIREETDEEYTKRIDNEKRYKERAMQMELNQYKKLKEKYGDIELP